MGVIISNYQTRKDVSKYLVLLSVSTEMRKVELERKQFRSEKVKMPLGQKTVFNSPTMVVQQRHTVAETYDDDDDNRHVMKPLLIQNDTLTVLLHVTAQER